MANQERGYQTVFTYGDLKTLAEDKLGKSHNVSIEPQWTSADPMTCLQILQKCTPVFSVVSGQANKVSALEMKIIPMTKEEDRIAIELKGLREMFLEFQKPGPFYFGKRLALYQKILKRLPDVFPDMSNFDACLRRWSNHIKNVKGQKCNQIEDFFHRPSKGFLWNDYIKMCVTDILTYGRLAVLKKFTRYLDGSSKIHSLNVLPGGSVVPVKGKYVGQVLAYVQLTGGMEKPQLFFQDELAFAQYQPNSALVNGLTPMDALIDMVAEHILFNRMMADKADGSSPPEKLVVFGEPDSGDDLAGVGTLKSDTLDKGEQRRIENKLNRIKREAAVAVLSGYGTPVLVDLSKSDILPTQMLREDQISKFVAMAWNVPQSAVNDTGSSGTSGRSTSEAQARAENMRSTAPVITTMEELHTYEIIPSAFEFGYMMSFDTPMSDSEKLDNITKESNSGVWSTNEIREREGADPYPEPEYNRPRVQPAGQQQADALGQIAARL